MIIKSIKNPKPHKLFGFIPYHQRSRPEAPQGHTNLTPTTPRLDGSLGQFPSSQQWDKLRYARWIESVKKTFSKEQLVTIASIHAVPGKVPYHFKIIDIQEVMQQVRWDQAAWEPRAITVQYKTGGIVDQRPPSTLRALTKEECDLVALHHTEPQGNA